MEFGWINLFGAVIVIVMLVPNAVYALRNRDQKNNCTNKVMNAVEQVGRYGCIVLMWLPLFVWEFGFANKTMFLLYIAGNVLLLAAYLMVFRMYLVERSGGRAMTLAVLPACIFLLSALTLRHWLLFVFAILFAAGHIYVTKKNIEARSTGN